MRRPTWCIAALLLALGYLIAADEPPTPDPTEPPPPVAGRKHLAIEVPPAAPETQPANAEPIPADVLRQMYARELGKAYQPAGFDQVYAAHELLESFFAEAAAKARNDILQKIRDTK